MLWDLNLCKHIIITGGTENNSIFFVASTWSLQTLQYHEFSFSSFSVYLKYSRQSLSIWHDGFYFCLFWLYFSRGWWSNPKSLELMSETWHFRILFTNISSRTKVLCLATLSFVFFTLILVSSSESELLILLD